MKLYLMRHGETLFNIQKRVQGWCDSPLTENGICQAEQAKQYFAKKGISFDAVYSSTQERATDTAKIVAPEYTVTHLKGIKEMNFGSFEAQPEHLLNIVQVHDPLKISWSHTVAKIFARLDRGF